MNRKSNLDAAAAFAWAVVIALMLGCSGQTPAPDPAAPSVDRGTNEGPIEKPTAAEDNSNSNPAFTAKAFSQSFNEDPQAFIREHQGKEIEVSGTVERYGYHSIDDLGDLWLDGLRFECQDRQPIAKALPGQTATLRGTCGEFGVTQWEVVNATGDPPPTFTTAELAKAITADAPGLAKRLSKGYLIVTGQIAKVEDEGSLIYLTPEGDEPEIKCTFVSSTPREKERNTGFETGQQVRILAEMLSPTSLYMCDALPVEATIGGEANGQSHLSSSTHVKSGPGHSITSRGFIGISLVKRDGSPIACYGVIKLPDRPAQYSYLLLFNNSAAEPAKAATAFGEGVGARGETKFFLDVSGQVAVGGKEFKIDYKFKYDEEKKDIGSESLKLNGREVDVSVTRLFLVDLRKDQFEFTPVQTIDLKMAPKNVDEGGWEQGVAETIEALKAGSPAVKSFLK